jgi:hypothetical protein
LELIEEEFFRERAHGANPEAGVNASFMSRPSFSAFRKETFPHCAGDAPHHGQSVMNFVPITADAAEHRGDRCLIRLARRYHPDESVESVLANIRRSSTTRPEVPRSRRNCGECPRTHGIYDQFLWRRRLRILW